MFLHSDCPETYKPALHVVGHRNPEVTSLVQWLGIAAPPVAWAAPTAHGAPPSATFRLKLSLLAADVPHKLVGGPPGGPGSRFSSVPVVHNMYVPLAALVRVAV